MPERSVVTPRSRGGRHGPAPCVVLPLEASRSRRGAPGCCRSGLCGTSIRPLLRRELDCVLQQVEHNLPDLSFVSAYLPSRSSTLVCRAMPLRPARSRTKLRALSSAVGRVEVRQLQLHPSRFDFREIEDVVDQGREMVPDHRPHGPLTVDATEPAGTATCSRWRARAVSRLSGGSHRQKQTLTCGVSHRCTGPTPERSATLDEPP